MNIIDLEADQALQDAVLSTYHALAHTFASVPTAAKIVENHVGKAYIENVMPSPVAFPFPFQTPTPGPPAPPP